MAEDIRSLTRKNAELEKRVKLAEAKIKSLADSMTDPTRIEKFMTVVSRDQTDLDKRLKREGELRAQAQSAAEKEWNKKVARIEAERKKDEHLKLVVKDLLKDIDYLATKVSNLESRRR